MKIGGNTPAILQISRVTENEYGNEEVSWQQVILLHGWLDLISGNTNHSLLGKKIAECDYVYICVYFDPVIDGVEVNEENSRMIIHDKVYEVKLIDDPMGLHEQNEIYLKYLGGQP